MYIILELGISEQYLVCIIDDVGYIIIYGMYTDHEVVEVLSDRRLAV